MKFTQETDEFLRTQNSQNSSQFSRYFDDGFWVCPDAEIYYDEVFGKGVLIGLSEFYDPLEKTHLIAKRQLLTVRFALPWFENETVGLTEAWIKNPTKKNPYNAGIDIGFRNALVSQDDTLFIGPVHDNSVTIKRPIRMEYQQILKNLINRRLFTSQG